MDIEEGRGYHAARRMKVFHCDHCGQLLFFENVVCVSCGHAVAYVPDLMVMASLEPVPPPASTAASTTASAAAPTAGSAAGVDGGRWTSLLTDDPLRLCANHTRYDVCNWAFPADDDHDLCASCRLTRTIPDLSVPGNTRLWY